MVRTKCKYQGSKCIPRHEYASIFTLSMRDFDIKPNTKVLLKTSSSNIDDRIIATIKQRFVTAKTRNYASLKRIFRYRGLKWNKTNHYTQWRPNWANQKRRYCFAILNFCTDQRLYFLMHSVQSSISRILVQPQPFSTTAL